MHRTSEPYNYAGGSGGCCNMYRWELLIFRSEWGGYLMMNNLPRASPSTASTSWCCQQSWRWLGFWQPSSRFRLVTFTQSFGSPRRILLFNSHRARSSADESWQGRRRPNWNISSVSFRYLDTLLPSWWSKLFSMPQGIPFALPPTGDLRFRAPQWIPDDESRVINATEYGFACLQPPVCPACFNCAHSCPHRKPNFRGLHRLLLAIQMQCRKTA